MWLYFAHCDLYFSFDFICNESSFIWHSWLYISISNLYLTIMTINTLYLNFEFRSHNCEFINSDFISQILIYMQQCDNLILLTLYLTILTLYAKVWLYISVLTICHKKSFLVILCLCHNVTLHLNFDFISRILDLYLILTLYVTNWLYSLNFVFISNVFICHIIYFISYNYDFVIICFSCSTIWHKSDFFLQLWLHLPQWEFISQFWPYISQI